MKKVHSFKFTKQDIIYELNRKGIYNYSGRLLDEAMREVSLTKAVEYVMLFQFQ